MLSAGCCLTDMPAITKKQTRPKLQVVANTDHSIHAGLVAVMPLPAVSASGRSCGPAGAEGTGAAEQQGHPVAVAGEDLTESVTARGAGPKKCSHWRSWSKRWQSAGLVMSRTWRRPFFAGVESVEMDLIATIAWGNGGSLFSPQCRSFRSRLLQLRKIREFGGLLCPCEFMIAQSAKNHIVAGHFVRCVDADIASRSIHPLRCGRLSKHNRIISR